MTDCPSWTGLMPKATPDRSPKHHLLDHHGHGAFFHIQAQFLPVEKRAIGPQGSPHQPEVLQNGFQALILTKDSWRPAKDVLEVSSPGAEDLTETGRSENRGARRSLSCS